MSTTERIIQVADLSFILNSIKNVNANVEAVSGQVASVGQEVDATRGELFQLTQEFAAFVAADLKAKELALAETRQVKIRQELETKFGYYAVVRRQATGILQAADISIVRQATIQSSTEELMISAPRYWLAPALIGLSAWLGDDKELAQRALAEALRRDDEKTSLFFALISRRAARTEGYHIWLERYFGLQNPLKLDRQTIVMLDAVVNGVFGVDVLGSTMKRIADWVAEISQQPGFVDAQRAQWTDALLSKRPTHGYADRYPHLARQSPTWPKLDSSLQDAALNRRVLSYFTSIFDGAIVPSPNLFAAVDDLLTKLVSEFDDEELPLRRQDELCRLVIEESGDKPAAQKRYDLQSKSLDERVDFSQLLTNAAMHPENSHASRATQRYAIANSRDWILAAHSDLVAKARMNVPAEVELQVEGWQGVTKDGRNEAQLVDELGRNLAAREQNALAKARLTFGNWAALVAGALLVVFGLFGNIILSVFGAVAVVWFFVARSKVGKLKQRIKAEFAQLKEVAVAKLKASVAEVVEYRREIVARDAFAPKVSELLNQISSEQFILSPHDGVRRVAVASK